MAMRLFSKAEFYAELTKFGFVSTGEKTETQEIWKTRDGQCIPVPCNQEQIPDSVLDTILAKVSQLYQCAAPAVSKTYTVTEQDAPNQDTALKVVK